MSLTLKAARRPEFDTASYLDGIGIAWEWFGLSSKTSTETDKTKGVRSIKVDKVSTGLTGTWFLFPHEHNSLLLHTTASWIYPP